jgi:hypothetical protein
MASYDSNSILSEITGTDSHIAPPSTTIKSTMAQSTSKESLRRDSLFLVLAPVLSTDYPAPQSATTIASPSTEAAAPVPEVQPVKKERRSSSVSSSEGLFKRKVLKLGPVFGGQQNSGSDFVELDEE